MNHKLKLSEVKKIKNKIIVQIRDNLYDATSFSLEHRGGPHVFKHGEDITTQFIRAHGKIDVEKLPQFGWAVPE